MAHVALAAGSGTMSISRWAATGCSSIRNGFGTFSSSGWLTGLWHGAAWTFVLWGLFFAVLLTAEKLWYGQGAGGNPHLQAPVCPAAASSVSFVLFDAASVQDALRTIAALFGLGGLPADRSPEPATISGQLCRRVPDRLPGGDAPARRNRPAAVRKQTRRASSLSVLEPAALLALLALCHRVSGGRFLQPLPVFPLLRRRCHV